MTKKELEELKCQTIMMTMVMKIAIVQTLVWVEKS